MKIAGCIGVDSGDVMLIRNKDLHLWTGDRSGIILGLLFWGRDEENVKELLKGQGYKVRWTEKGRSVFIQADSMYKIKVLSNIINEICEIHKYIVVQKELYDNPRNRRMLNYNLVKLPIQTGKEEHCYISSTFIGDGEYPVYLTKDTAIVTFEEKQNWGKYTKEIIGLLELETGEQLTFIDPCYLGDELDTKLGISFSLEPGNYTVIHFKNKDGNLALGISKF